MAVTSRLGVFEVSSDLVRDLRGSWVSLKRAPFAKEWTRVSEVSSDLVWNLRGSCFSLKRATCKRHLQRNRLASKGIVDM